MCRSNSLILPLFSLLPLLPPPTSVVAHSMTGIVVECIFLADCLTRFFRSYHDPKTGVQVRKLMGRGEVNYQDHHYHHHDAPR